MQITTVRVYCGSKVLRKRLALEAEIQGMQKVGEVSPIQWYSKLYSNHDFGIVVKVASAYFLELENHKQLGHYVK